MKRLLSVLAGLVLAIPALAQGPIYSGGFIVKDSKGNNISGDDNHVGFAGPTTLDLPAINTILSFAGNQVLGLNSGRVISPALLSGLTFDGSTLSGYPGSAVVIEDFQSYSVGANPTINAGVNWNGQTAVIAGNNGIINNPVDTTGLPWNGLCITNTGAGGNGEFKRAMPWGNKWKKLRFGLMLRVNTNTTSFPAEFAIGVCSGTVNGYGSGSTANFIGMTSRPTNANSFTFHASSASVDYPTYSSAFTGFGTKHLGVETEGTLSGNGVINLGVSQSAAGKNRMGFVFQITRPQIAASVAYVCLGIDGQWPNNNGESNDFDCSPMTLLNSLFNLAGSGYLGATFNMTSTITTSESNGAFDTFDFYWSGTTAGIEIDYIAIFRIN